LQGRREQAFVATKLVPLVPVGPVVRQRAQASARRLGTDRIDLYQVHWPNPVVPESAVMAAMGELRRSGLVRFVGVSNYPLDRWIEAEEALGAPVLSNQVSFSLVERAPEAELVPYAARRGRVVIAYSPLAQGLLSARYDPDHRPRAMRAVSPWFLPDNLERARPLFEALRRVGKAHGAEPAQVALAWVVRHPNVVAIPGASSESQLDANVDAADLLLSDAEVEELAAEAAALRPVTGIASVPAFARLLLRRS
jgi:aryl-alcohol dehydrogenase-like predicted oxidoreductase